MWIPDVWIWCKSQGEDLLVPHACRGLCAGAPTPGCASLCPFFSRATVSSDSGRTMVSISSGASLSLATVGDEFRLWNQIGSTKFEVFCFLLIFHSRPYSKLTAGRIQSPYISELQFLHLQNWEVRIKLFWDIGMERTMAIMIVQLAVNIRKGDAMFWEQNQMLWN